ncbi:MAG: hypothetical protein ACOYBY_01430 [Dermatophilaceae bacterium]
MSAGRPLLTLAAAGAGFAILLGVDMVSTPAPAVVATDQPAAATTPAVGSPAAPATAAGPASVAATGAVATPAAAAFPPEAVYVGRASDGRTTVALAVRNERAAAYLCDGRSAEAWLTGTVTASTAALSGAGSTLTAQPAAGGATVSFALGGRTLTATLAPAAKPAGLYRARTSNGRTTVGWIVLPDGTQVGIENSAGTPTPAPSLPSDRSVTLDGQAVTGQEVRGDEQF